LKGGNEVREHRERVLYDFGSKDERRVVLRMMNELRNGVFELKEIELVNWTAGHTSVEERTSAGGKCAGQVMRGVHVTSWLL
jgi:hypothetical protein